MKIQGMRDGGLDKLLEKGDLRVAGEGRGSWHDCAVVAG